MKVHMRVLVWAYIFISLGQVSRNEISGSHDNIILNIARNKCLGLYSAPKWPYSHTEGWCLRILCGSALPCTALRLRLRGCGLFMPSILGLLLKWFPPSNPCKHRLSTTANPEEGGTQRCLWLPELGFFSRWDGYSVCKSSCDFLCWKGLFMQETKRRMLC